MVNNAQKIPLYRALNQAAQNRVLDALQLVGKELPCSVVSTNGWIVTVKFEVNAAPFTLPQVTIPVASSTYDYLPLQAGDQGVVWSADAYLGGVSGLGGGTATLRLMANLSALVFQPIGNTAFPAPPTPGTRVVQGPDGVLIQSLDASVSIYLNQVTGKVEITGDLVINGKEYLSHEHGGVTTGAPTSYSGGVHDP